jgi:transcriptional regulator with XRE-family HTH domain
MTMKNDTLPRRPGRRKGIQEQRKSTKSTADILRAQFLRACRARIKPSDVGLHAGRYSRTEGLRREDVAALSGVSVSWYTWLEQGRRMRVSDDVLDQLCQALRLNEDERVYLFSLVQQRSPRSTTDIGREVPPDVLRLINSLSLPGIVLNQRWDVLAWNALQALIYRDYSKIPIEERNLADILFTKPTKHMTAAQFEQTASRVVARLRYNYSCCIDTANFDALIYRLNALSPLFKRLWSSPEFTLRSHGVQRFMHARFGPLSLEHNSFTPDGHPHLRVIICAPENAATRLALAQANAELARTRRSTAMSGGRS